MRRRADNTLGTDLPLELRRDELRPLADNRLEARIIIGQPFDLGIGLLITFQNRTDPQRRADDPVGNAEQVKNLSRALANGYGAGGCLLESDLLTAAVDRQGIGGFGGICTDKGQSPKHGGQKAGMNRQASRMKHVFSSRK